MMVTCQKVTKNEIGCSIVVIIASVVMMTDKEGKKIGQEISLTTELIALLISIPGAIMFFFNVRVKQAKVPAKVIVSFQIVLLMVLHNICAIIMHPVKWDMSDEGLFGFMRSENIIYVDLIYGIGSGFLGLVGMTILSYLLPPLVTMNAILLEPFFGQMLGVYLGIETMPGIKTWIGFVFIVGAINVLAFKRKAAAAQADVQKRKSAMEADQELTPSK
jgi:drug/metabolite transporter (DMT)-like permease